MAIDAIVNARIGGSGTDGERVAPEALTTAVHSVFVATAVLAIVLLCAVLLMPPDRHPSSLPTPGTVTAGRTGAAP